MTTLRTPSEPPSSTQPYAPLAHSVAVKSNPHPYAIKTTSTGILSRSNSSGQNYSASRHHYVPPSSRAPSTGIPFRGHRRASKSLSSVMESPHKMPRPLPVPPEFSSNAAHGNRNGYISDSNENPCRYPWDGAQPSYPAPLFPVLTGGPEELPSNPKLWSPSQLASYLTTALRVTPVEDIEALPLAVVHDIATFVKEARISGRIFLRLIEEDLERRGVNQKWRKALIAASYNLRQNVIKGRIWADTESSARDTGAPSLSPRPFFNDSYNSSSSSVDLNSEPEQLPIGRRHGRVRGMVASFERSGSFSSDSGLEPDYTDRHAAYSYGARPDNSPVVSGGAFSSSPVDGGPLPIISPAPIQADSQDEPTMEALLAAAESSNAAKSHRHSWGARAWEELDVDPAQTVKRIVDDSTGNAVTKEIGNREITRTVVGPGSGKEGSAGSSAGKERSSRRVVTAIFTHPPLADTAPANDSQGSAPAAQEDVNQSGGVSSVQNPPSNMEEHEAPSGELYTERERALAAELAKTRAIAVALQKRVEECERRRAELEQLVARQEEDLRNAQPKSRLLFSTEVQTQVIVDCSSKLQSAESTETTGIPSSLPRASSPSLVAETSPAAKYPDDSSEEGELGSLSELPKYVFLVGVGVCAVALKVMLKRAGRGWRL